MDIETDPPSSAAWAERDATPETMDSEYLVELAFQLYARACHPNCTEELHNRAIELKREVLRRVIQR